jgi:hypothetical protein
VAVGSSLASGIFSVAIAGDATANGAVAVNGTASGNGAVAIGGTAAAEGVQVGNSGAAVAHSIALGRQAVTSGSAAIALGRDSAASANQLTAGSSTYYLTNVLLGGGDGDDNTRTLDMRTSNALSANTDGWAFGIHAGRGRGTGAGGAFGIYTSPPGAAGATLNTDDLTLGLTHQAVTIGRLATAAVANQIQKGGASVPFTSERTTCGSNGQAFEDATISELLDLTVATSTTATIPAGCRIMGTSFRITTTITGLTGAGTWRAGIAGNTNLFTSATTTVAAGSTFVGLNHVGTTAEAFAAAASVLITLTNGPVTAGAIRVVVHYRRFGPATS